MLHRVFPFEKYATLDDQDIFERVMRSLGRRGAGKELLFTGFEGTDVARQRSFGEKWHTFALTSQEVDERFRYGNDTVTDYVHLETNRLPALAIFDGAILRSMTIGSALAERYEAETGQLPDVEEYGVEGLSLDVGALAVFYFEPEHRPSLEARATSGARSHR